MNSPYESIIGIRSHGGVALREAPDITGSLHEIMLGMGRDLEEIHIGDCGIHQGAEKNNPRILSPSLLRARSLGLTHVHADHGAAIPDFFRQRKDAGIQDPLSIIASPYSRKLFPPVAFQSAFIHDEERKRKSQVISETHQELIAILSTWKTSFSGPRHFNRNRRHRSNHKKSDFERHDVLQNTILQEHNREMGEQLFLSRINFIFGNKESRFFNPEIKHLLDALIGELRDDNRRARNAAFILLGKNLHDYFTLKRESLPPPLSQYVKESLEHFVQVSTAFGGEASYSYKVNGHLEVDMYSTAHVLGSQALLYKVKLVSGRVVKILMAGDIGRYDHNPLGSPMWPSQEIDIAYLEGTYGTKDHPDRVKEVGEFVAFLNERISKKGDILIPVFQIQKLQDICLLLYELRTKGLLLGDVQFYTSGSLVETLNNEYALHPAYEKVFKSGIFQNLDIKTKQLIMNGKKSSHARIHIAVGGSLQNESSSGKMVEYYSGPDDAVVLAGYQFPQTIGYDLSHGIPHPLVDVNHVFQLQSFSAHAGHKDLVRVAKELNTKKIVLVHGEPGRIQGLKEVLDIECPGKKIVIGERDKIEPID